MVTFLPTYACVHVHRPLKIYTNHCSWTETVCNASVLVQ